MSGRMPETDRAGQVPCAGPAARDRRERLDAPQHARSPRAISTRRGDHRSLHGPEQGSNAPPAEVTSVVVAGPSRSAWIVSLVLGLAACKEESEEPARPRGADEERTLATVQSYVYATPNETTLQIAGRIRDQIRSAFGTLKSLRVTSSNREVANDVGELLYREPLVLVQTDGREAIVERVWFRYTDEVVAPASVPRGVPMLVGGLHRQDEASFDRILIACTANTTREREFRGRLQSVFDGSLSTCQDAILGEQAVIDAARVRLDSPEEETVPEEFDRTFVPVVARLLERKLAQMTGRYPRFETVVPQTGRVVAASSPAAGRAKAAVDEDTAEGPFAGVLAGADRPAGVADEPRPDKPTPIVIPNAGVGEPGRAGTPAAEEPHDPDAPPEPQVAAPVVVAEGPKGPGMPIQPRGGDGGSSFEWDDLLDKKFLALWIAVFALYPLLKRRSGGG